MFLFRRNLIRFFSSVVQKPRSKKLEVDSLNKALSSPGVRIEWQSIRDDLIASVRRANTANIDGIILGLCSQERRLDVAKSYINFLKSQSLQINDVSVSQLLRMFYNNCEYEGNAIASEDEVQIIKLCRSLIDKHEILEATLAENIIHGLSLTREWLECLKVLEHVKENYQPSKSTYSCIIARALKEDNLDIAWKLLDEMFLKQLAPTTSVLLKYFKKFQNDNVNTEKLLNAFSEHSLMLPEESVGQFQEVFINSKVVNINTTGKCPSCSSFLPSAELNEAEFNLLSDTFLNKVFLRNDVFLQTNPEELRKFKSFVAKTVPYDCVIDGLNVAYSHGTGLTPAMMAHNVASVVEYFVNRKQTCLVIGRKHMLKWPADKLNYIKNNSSFFLAENISKDDPFLLYAALKSGPQTNIFSRDLMRGHSCLLDKESLQLFRRWQKQHQFVSYSVVQRRIHVDEPIAFELRTKKVGSFWHIPFTSENLSYIYETFEMPSSWLCVEIK